MISIVAAEDYLSQSQRSPVTRLPHPQLSDADLPATWGPMLPLALGRLQGQWQDLCCYFLPCMCVFSLSWSLLLGTSPLGLWALCSPQGVGQGGRECPCSCAIPELPGAFPGMPWNGSGRRRRRPKNTRAFPSGWVSLGGVGMGGQDWEQGWTSSSPLSLSAGQLAGEKLPGKE